MIQKKSLIKYLEKFSIEVQDYLNSYQPIEQLNFFLQGKCLWVVRGDRFSRNTEESYIMINKLKSEGIEVRWEETFDWSDSASVLLRALKLAEPEIDNRRRAKN